MLQIKRLFCEKVAVKREDGMRFDMQVKSKRTGLKGAWSNNNNNKLTLAPIIRGIFFFTRQFRKGNIINVCARTIPHRLPLEPAKGPRIRVQSTSSSAIMAFAYLM